MSSWFQDPKLFICNADDSASDGFNVYRCLKELGSPISVLDLAFLGNGLSEHLSLGDKNESDFDDLLAYLIDFYIRSGSNIWKIVNCQGLAIIWDQSTCGQIICSWSREPLDSPCYNLPGITPPVDAEKEALMIRVSDLESRNSTLEAEVQRKNKDMNALIREKEDLEKQVFELTLQLKECCGSADEEPWKSGNSVVPNNWVPFEDLDVLNIPRNTSLKISKAPGALKFVEDNTTNVRASRFHGGISVAAVNVEDLIPEKDEARFDPDIWGSYNDAGTSYAARMLSESEM